MTPKCIHCYVSGKVQGVCFRAYTKEKAEKLGITGRVRNLADCRVEVSACGTQDQLEILYKWLQHGPAFAKVTECTCEDVPWKEYNEFDCL